MSAFKGTPGPWEVVENPDSGGGDTAISNAASIYSECKTYVADVYRGYVGSESVTHDQQIANARLIAAAPALLEALEQLIGPEDDPKAGWRGWTPSTEMFRCEFCGQEDLDCGRIQHDDRCPIKAARAAIAKATGEQP